MFDRCLYLVLSFLLELSCFELAEKFEYYFPLVHCAGACGAKNNAVPETSAPMCLAFS